MPNLLTPLVAAFLFAFVGCATAHPKPVGASPALPTPKGQFVDVNGLKMYYEIRGTGRPLVLLHGGGSSIETTFGKILPYFVKDRQVIAIEQQAHGHTADIERDLSFDDMADDTNSLLEAIGIDSADVFGFSNGATTALELAIRHPARVRKLVLGSGAFRSDGLLPALRQGFKKPPSLAAMPEALKTEYRRIAPNPDGLLDLVKKTVKMMRNFADIPRSDLKEILSPALVLVGDQDVVTVSHEKELAKLIRGSRLVVFPGGHGTYIGEATTPPPSAAELQKTATLIKSFLDEGT
jgi:pimeloyl-ACP methyl ester carboxylesterase